MNPRRNAPAVGVFLFLLPLQAPARTIRPAWLPRGDARRPVGLAVRWSRTEIVLACHLVRRPSAP